ncbi:MAG TPA: YebC/PmpR family DNA-binding transcriptional regulator, partial [Deltaproteobacteria bacterium]|nr:YebC/PmpR family DNA-binding transcriptional regulator [Deltaproteobacteria bacterium]
MAFMFNRMGLIRLKPEGVDRDDLELEMIDFGLEDLVDGEDDNGNPLLVLRCAFNDFGTLQGGVEAQGIESVSTGSEFVPTTF